MTFDNINKTGCDGRALLALMQAGMHSLQQHRAEVNRMNVFPVPDGDTGNNMLLTVQKAVQFMQQANTDHAGEMAQAMAKGGLHGARGNSGTILSMLMRGFANSLTDTATIDPELLKTAAQNAVTYAYETVGAVMEPVEGTILTVAKDTANALQQPAEDASSTNLIDTALVAAKHSLENTPQLLEPLREAGVVDSGGMGLVYLLEGMQRLIHGDPIEVDTDEFVPDASETDWQTALRPDDEAGYGYDVQFLMQGENLDVAAVRQAISAMGWSPLVDGDETLIKVHIHVHDPGELLSYAIQQGATLDDIVVENMQAQYENYVRQRSADEAILQIEGVAVIAVVQGAGFKQLYREYGAAALITGGQTMNPETDDFLQLIDKLPNDEIIILPNNSNIRLAAEQAAKETTARTVRVLNTKSMPEGLVALLAYGDAKARGDNLEQILTEMTLATGDISTGEITTAVRDSVIGGVSIKKGDALGFLDGKLVARGNGIDAAVIALIDTVDLEGYELITLYYGVDVRPHDVEYLLETLTERFGYVEIVSIAGGQALYPYLLSLE